MFFFFSSEEICSLENNISFTHSELIFAGLFDTLECKLDYQFGLGEFLLKLVKNSAILKSTLIASEKHNRPVNTCDLILRSEHCK